MKSKKDKKNSNFESKGKSFDNQSDGRFIQNYGYGSQQENKSYRDFSSQGRNSGLGNQSGYSSYGNHNDDKQNYSSMENQQRKGRYPDEAGQGGREWESNRGKGPKGYQRSDERILEEANESLTHDHLLDASEITVEVQKGEVTLTGEVASKEDKRRAEELVDSISGVTHLENRIRVNKKAPVKREAPETTSETQVKKQRTSNGVHA